MWKLILQLVDANIQKNPTVVDFYEKNGFRVNTPENRRSISMRKDIFK